MVRNPQHPVGDAFAVWRSAVERRLAALERVDKLTSASVGSGGLSIVDAGTLTLFDGDGDPAIVFSPGSPGPEADGYITMTPFGIKVAGLLMDAAQFSALTDTGANVSQSTSPVEGASVTYTPPNGATHVQILALASNRIFNTSGGVQAAHVTLERDGSIPFGFTGQDSAPNNGHAQAITFAPAVVELSGNVTVSAEVSVGSGTNSSNSIYLACLFIGYRSTSVAGA